MERSAEKTVKALRQLERYNPDLVEIRFDGMKSSSSISKIRSATNCALIATNRSKKHGGGFVGPENRRIGTLMQAAQAAFDYVDLELETKDVGSNIRGLKRSGTRVIVSYHNATATPSAVKLGIILSREKRAGADICKIVTTANSYADNLRCLTFLNQHAGATRLVCFCMGKLGVASRVLSPLFGGHFTFASSGVGSETAAGQIPITIMRAIHKELGAT